MCAKIEVFEKLFAYSYDSIDGSLVFFVAFLSLAVVSYYAELTVAFEAAFFHLGDIFNSLFAKLAHEFVFGDHFAVHVLADHSTVLDQNEGLRFEDSRHYFGLKPKPVNKIIPKDDYAYQY